MKDESPVALEAQIKALAQTYKAIMMQYGQVLTPSVNTESKIDVENLDYENAKALFLKLGTQLGSLIAKKISQ